MPIHKGYAINRLRQFYIRKVKFTQTNFHDKLSVIINTARNLISKISKDYVKLLKYGDSLYRCKSLKVAAIGRMCTVIKRIGPCFAYLEQIRQHMARLPSIDPNTRTILICGYPNVGKSSFINKITKADVDVQPYAFTTKSLFVGHTDYKYLRYQVIDTSGILYRPFEDRNIIEMCTITALAHLRAAVFIAQQAALFHSIKSLFVNKPLIIVCNKTDLQLLDGLSEEDMNLVKEMKTEAIKTVNIGAGGEPSDDENVLLTMSTLTEEGVIYVKKAACERLLNQRVKLKMKSKKINDCLNRFLVAVPKPRDQKERAACIPQQKEKKKLERDLEEENGGAGVYSASLKKHYILAHDEWKEDNMPEILDGHNVYDFVDPDILERVEKLEREEELRLEHEGDEEDVEMDGNELTPEGKEALAAIRKKKSLCIQLNRMKKSTKPKAINHSRSKSIERGRKMERSRGDIDVDAMEMDDDRASKMLRLRSQSRPRSSSRPSDEIVPGEGFRDALQKGKALKLAYRASKKRNKDAKIGEADRTIPNLKPKHLFSGKRGVGKTNRR
ncbi:hypothetical protein MKX01_040410 [Papaver californicum]|nr:hypothetical protein MKX01_040410 [Papaver californicum]